MRTALYQPAFIATLVAIVCSSAANSSDSFFKDLHVEQMAMVENIPMESANETATGNGLRMTAMLDRADATYRTGDSVVLTVETTEDAYIWVFDTGTSGRVYQIFPNEYATDNFVRAGVPVVLPAPEADYQFVVSQPVGVELLTVVASQDDKPLTQDLIDKETGAGPFLAMLGTGATFSKDIVVAMERDHPNAVSSHQVFRVVE